MKTKVSCVVCPSCKDVIYSRARHDFHRCSCGEVAVDGGFDYLKISYKTVRPEVIVKEIDASKQELYDDWNNRLNKFGFITPSTNTVE
jgi:ribosomal protein L37AE/L43A